jgi:dihydroceramidase
LFIALLGAAGIIWANPTRDWRFTFQHAALSVVGLGSMALHGTLGAIWQSADEVPMLWQNIIFFYVLAEVHSPKGKNRIQYLPEFLVTIGVIQTVLYYTMQQFYAAFLASFIGSLVTVIVWTSIIVFEDKRDHIISKRKTIWYTSLICSMLIGATLWIFEMNFCDHLQNIYLKTGGATLHIIWHIGASIGSYLGTVLLTVVRMQHLEIPFRIKWIGGILPAAVVNQKKDC